MSRRPWTTVEVTLLKTLYPNAPMSHLVALLDRTTTAIYVKAQKLGLNRLWTPAEEWHLALLYPDTPMALISQALERSSPSIYGKAKELGLKRSAQFLAGEHSGRVRSDQPRGVATRFKKRAPVQSGLV